MNSELAQLALLLFGSVALGGLLPYTRRWSEEGLHALVALSAGIFLGAVFLHLVPELAVAAGHWDGEGHEGHGHGPRGHGDGAGMWVWACFAGGLVGLWFLERLFVHRAVGHAVGHGPGVAGAAGHSHHADEDHSHRDESHKKHELAWRATLFGLSVHALLTGLGLAGVAERPGHWALWSAMLLHKLTEGFSLGTLLRLGKLRLGVAVAVVLGFSLVAPLGLLLGRMLAVELGPLADLLTAFAAGTFLFVALFELLPEVLHGRGSRLARAALVVAGVVLAGMVPSIDADAWAAWGTSALRLFLDLAPFVLLGLSVAGAWHGMRGPARAPRSAGAAGVHLVAAPQAAPTTVFAGAAVFDPALTLARPILGAVAGVFVGAALRTTAGVSDAQHGAATAGASSAGRVARALEYAVVDAVDDLGGALVCGLVAAAALFVLVPEAAFGSAFLGGPLAYGAALVIGWPLRFHPMAALPIAAALLARGVAPGAALVFLLASSALNAATHRRLAREFGARAAGMYSGSLAGVSLALGLSFGVLYGALGGASRAGQLGVAWPFAPGLHEAAGAALAVMLLASFLRRLRHSVVRAGDTHLAAD
ncbi:MAG: hypothetical protein GC161_13685 [Planctomycetaceae bacterium]|nr:hypothetical protein [Planctomycetaceae bacterium]